MSRSFINLRRALFGVSCVIVFGFGATEAFATLRGPGPCQPTGYPYIPTACRDLVGCPGLAYCDGYNTNCVCDPM
jgi:hypothetical protein